MTAPSTNNVKEIKAGKKLLVVAMILFAATGAGYIIITSSAELDLEDSAAFHRLATDMHMYTLILVIGLVLYFAIKHFMRWKWLGC